MMNGYCVFWIPSIYHVAPVPLSENSFLEKEDISDEVGCQCHLSLKLDSQENIIVILSLRGIDVEFSLMHKGLTTMALSSIHLTCLLLILNC